MSTSTWLTDQQLEELLDRYFASAYQEDDWPKRLKELVEDAKSQVFNLDAVDALPDEDLVERLVSIYRNIVQVPLYYKAIANHPSQVREALRYLLQSDDDIVAKTNALRQRDGPHYRKGLGKSFWSFFLMALDPSKNPYWNNKTEDALDALGMARWSSSDSPGEVYLSVAEAETALANLHPQADLYSTDHFMHFVTVLEGHEMLQEWRGEGKKPVRRPKDWTDRIEEWRSERIPPQRISARREAEGEARELLESNLGDFDEDLLRRFFELANSDYYGGQVRRNRFSPAFVGAYANRIVEQLDLFNEWSARLWQASDEELKRLLDLFWQERPIVFAGTSLPTLILYLRNPDRYNVWLGVMVDGVNRLDGPIPSSTDADAYFRYNEAVNELRQLYDWQPQETDVILWEAARHSEAPEQGTQAAAGAFQGFRRDTFTFLEELEQNNSAEWFDANRDRYKSVLREPLRNLFKDVGPSLLRLDPNLETEAKYGKVMANIRKRWSDDAGEYYPYLWGAFYQADQTKQTHAQLFVIVGSSYLSVGIGAGKGAEDAVDTFRENIQTHPRLFYQLLEPLLDQGLMVTTYEAHGIEEHQVVDMSSPDDVPRLADLNWVDVERHYSPEDDILYRPEFAEEVTQLFKALYPLYLFFVSDDIESAVAPFWQDEISELPEPDEKYTLEDLQTDTFLDVDFLDRVETLLLDKGQIVFYGPPGTGKTFVAKKFARYFVDQVAGHVRVVQFHPSYAYEEFVEGIRPHSEKGQLTYPIEPGLFRRLCDEARVDPDSRYVLIIDEINRGSLPRIFGELLYLLEYRDETEPVILPYSKKRFTIPKNVYMIGTMNTADRSIALVDHALRRRFHFIPFKPDPEILLAWLRGQGKEMMAWTADLLQELNRRLSQDQIDWNLHIGHSHWMVKDALLDERRAELIWQHSILPTLEEYFYKSSERLQHYDYEELKSIVTPED